MIYRESFLNNGMGGTEIFTRRWYSVVFDFFNFVFVIQLKIIVILYGLNLFCIRKKLEKLIQGF